MLNLHFYNEIYYDLNKNADYVTYKKANGITKYKMFRARKSKRVFDKVDKFFGEKLEFTDDMIKFLINYDIKYRTDEASD